MDNPIDTPLAATDSPSYSYDQVPYTSWPYPQSQPARLAMTARLFGMQPPPLEEARVLELGCAAGGNLIPHAEMFPEGKFVGVDLSARQVADGQATIRELGLTNVELSHRNILDIDATLGKFDYIVCHGVYSWVPTEVQQRILELIQRHLTPSGVAYVSYNTYPGWRMRSMIRDMLCFHAEKFKTPQDRVAQARGLLKFLQQSTTSQGNLYSAFLKQEVELFSRVSDHYLYHEYLEEVNEPTYFFEFARRAADCGLQYLGESDFATMSAAGFPREVEMTLTRVASDLIQMEQYLDFLRNRTFRQTLLCHKDVPLDRSLKPQFVQKLYVTSKLKPDGDPPDLRSPAPARFKNADVTVNASAPLFKAALLALEKVWPQSLSFETLLHRARASLNPEPVLDASRVAAEVQLLGEHVLQCFSRGAIELSAGPARFASSVSQRPQAARLARLQAHKGPMVTNRRHEVIQLNDVGRHVVRFADGARDRNAILSELLKLVDSQTLVVQHEGTPVTERGQASAILEGAMDRSLQLLAQQALLVG